MCNSHTHDPQTEARAIAERFPAWPTGWGLELRNRVIGEIATALSAKDAELAALEKSQMRQAAAAGIATARAERAEAQLAEINRKIAEKDKALVWYENNVAGCRLIHSGGDAHRNALAQDGGERARRALTGGQEE